MLFGPLTGFEAVEEPFIDNGVRWLTLRPTVNQRAVRIEELAGWNKRLHLETLESMKRDISDAIGGTETGLKMLVDKFANHILFVQGIDAQDFHVHHFNQLVINAGFDLKGLITSVHDTLNIYKNMVGGSLTEVAAYLPGLVNTAGGAVLVCLLQNTQ